MAELYAVRGNKHLKITEAERAAHLALGYDIAKADGDTLAIVEVAPDKVVSYAKYKAALNQIEDLKKGLAKAKKGKALEEALAENEVLKAELAGLKESGGKEGGK